MDRIYTPSSLAQQMISLSRSVDPQVIADFASGAGSLLTAARERWPAARLVGCDVDEECIRSLQEGALDEFVPLDFFDDERRRTSEYLSALAGRVDLILLNPPFSCRSGKLKRIDIDGQHHLVGPALAFVAHALDYLSRGGELLALLPESALTSARDKPLLDALQCRYEVELLSGRIRAAFQRHCVNVHIVRLQRRAGQAPRVMHACAIDSASPTQKFQVSLIRGRNSVHSTEPDPEGIPFVHTTVLRDNRLAADLLRVRTTQSIIRGPAIFIPRVGRPAITKLVLYDSAEALALSDCVIALLTASRADARAIYYELIAAWGRLSAEYKGSCATYLTHARLEEVLRTVGCVVCDPLAIAPVRAPYSRAPDRQPPRIDLAPRRIARGYCGRVGPALAADQWT